MIEALVDQALRVVRRREREAQTEKVYREAFRDPAYASEQEEVIRAFDRASGLLTVLPVTSVKPGRSPHPFEVFLPAGAAGNPVDSIILPHQIRTISAGRLRQRYGQLNDTSLRREVAEKVLGHLGFSDLREVEEEP